MNEEKKEAEKESTITLRDLVEGVEMEICNHYCKYPEQYGDDNDDLIDEQCSHCPFIRL